MKAQPDTETLSDLAELDLEDFLELLAFELDAAAKAIRHLELLTDSLTLRTVNLRRFG